MKALKARKAQKRLAREAKKSSKSSRSAPTSPRGQVEPRNRSMTTSCIVGDSEDASKKQKKRGLHLSGPLLSSSASCSPVSPRKQPLSPRFKLQLSPRENMLLDPSDVEDHLHRLAEGDTALSSSSSLHPSSTSSSSSSTSSSTPAASALSNSDTDISSKGGPLSSRLRRAINRRKSVGAAKAQQGVSVGAVSEPLNVKKTTWMTDGLEWVGDAREHFQVIRELGEGAFAKVFLAKHKKSGHLLAVKELIPDEGVEEAQSVQDPTPATTSTSPSPSDSGDLRIGTAVKLTGAMREEVEKEVDVMRQCRHENIVSYYGTCLNGNNFWILMDYCEGGSLRDLIELMQQPIRSERMLAEIMRGTLKGLKYLHKCGIVHRDIKGGNILFQLPPAVRLADFGVSVTLEGGEATDIAGSPFWMAPEVILQRGFGPECDIWSLGITLIEACEGLPPRHDMHPSRVMRMVPSLPPPALNEPMQWSEDLRSFLTLCLQKQPKDRPSANQLLSQPLISNATNPNVLAPLLMSALKKKHERDAPKPRYIHLHMDVSSKARQKWMEELKDPGRRASAPAAAFNAVEKDTRRYDMDGDADPDNTYDVYADGVGLDFGTACGTAVFNVTDGSVRIVSSEETTDFAFAGDTVVINMGSEEAALDGKEEDEEEEDSGAVVLKTGDGDGDDAGSVVGDVSGDSDAPDWFGIMEAAEKRKQSSGSADGSGDVPPRRRPPPPPPPTTTTGTAQRMAAAIGVSAASSAPQQQQQQQQQPPATAIDRDMALETLPAWASTEIKLLRQQLEEDRQERSRLRELLQRVLQLQASQHSEVVQRLTALEATKNPP